MMTRTFQVQPYGWTFRVYIPLSCYWADEILGHLFRLGATKDIMRSANVNLRCSNFNNGLTYASPEARETLVVVGKASSTAELFNSVVHEIDHACMFTFPLIGITPGTEEAAYFKGGLGREIFPMIQPYLCECCRRKIGQKKGPNQG